MTYETDFFTWTQAQAVLLRERRHEGLDWDNLSDEIESMGRSDRRQLASRLAVLLAYLLIGWKEQPDRNRVHIAWRITIRERRDQIRRLLRDSPSLRPTLDAVLAEEWPSAVEWAMVETELDRDRFPDCLQWTAEQILDEEFFP